MSQIDPKISIGLPVYNGDNYIEQAIRSILEQTWGDFELIISDNASEDRTEEICRDHAVQDRRIRYYRNDSNIGAARNFNLTVELSRGEYFKWAAHDDILAPEYLEKCLDALEQDESLILSFPQTVLVDHCGDLVSKYEVKMSKISSERPQDRFTDLILVSHWGIEIFGLFRKSVIDGTNLLASFPGADRTFMAEVSLLGRLYEIPEYLFYSRDHSKRSTKIGTIHSRAGWWDTKNKGKTVFPQWRLLYELFSIVKNAKLSPRERAQCYLSMAAWFAHNHNLLRMFLDLATAVEPRLWEYVQSIKRKYSKDDKKELRDTNEDLMS